MSVTHFCDCVEKMPILFESRYEVSIFINKFKFIFLQFHIKFGIEFLSRVMEAQKQVYSFLFIIFKFY